MYVYFVWLKSLTTLTWHWFYFFYLQNQPFCRTKGFNSISHMFKHFAKKESCKINSIMELSPQTLWNWRSLQLQSVEILRLLAIKKLLRWPFFLYKLGWHPLYRSNQQMACQCCIWRIDQYHNLCPPLTVYTTKIHNNEKYMYQVLIMNLHIFKKLPNLFYLC